MQVELVHKESVTSRDGDYTYTDEELDQTYGEAPPRGREAWLNSRAPPLTIRSRQTTRHAVNGSAIRIMPSVAVPTAPMPVRAVRTFLQLSNVLHPSPLNSPHCAEWPST